MKRTFCFVLFVKLKRKVRETEDIFKVAPQISNFVGVLKYELENSFVAF
jgi:predicted RNA binding protein with dsRBD fold (UPF0201 family)